MKNINYKYKLIILTIIYGMLSFPFVYSGFGNSADHTGIYVLNQFGISTYKFGSELYFTYGPLGFLSFPMMIKNNIVIGFAFYFMLFVSQLYFWILLLKKYKISYSIIIINLLMVLFSKLSSSADYYVCYCAFLALIVLWRENNKYALAFEIILSTSLFFIKFSVAIAVYLTIFLYVITQYFRLKKWYPNILLVSIIPLSIVFFILYNPSIHSLWMYMKTAAYISSGYNVAMSLSNLNMYIVWGIALIAFYLGIMLSLFLKKGFNNAFLLLWFTPALFTYYKHGFVRADAHLYNAISGVISIFSITLLALDFEEIARIMKVKDFFSKAIVIMTTFVLIIPILCYDPFTNPVLYTKDKISQIPFRVEHIMNRKNAYDGLHPVPERFVEIIGKESVTTFSSEAAYLAQYNMTYIPLPTVHPFMAYTPELDKILADFFESKIAPQYIILNFWTIDNRIPLLETPASWKNVIQNYEVIEYDETTNWFLLRKGNNKEDKNSVAEATAIVKNDSTIGVEDFSEIFVDFELNWLGKLAKIFWKIDPVNIKIRYMDGTERTGRIVPENLVNGLCINSLPYDKETVINTFSNENAPRINTITFSGPGLKFYKKQLKIRGVIFQD
ncbi:MAG: hypothetical protein HFG58_01260 [Lachnospiraceae bacterium]|nr:hypothetical protein [Lachnospiraceae bacterium]